MHGREVRVWQPSHGTRATSDLLSGAVIIVASRAGGTSRVTVAVAAAVAVFIAATVARAAKKAVTGIVAAGVAALAVTIAGPCQLSPIACATDSTRDHWRMLLRETCLLVVWCELPTAGRREHGDVNEHPAHRSGRATAMLDRHARRQTGHSTGRCRGRCSRGAGQSMRQSMRVTRREDDNARNPPNKNAV